MDCNQTICLRCLPSPVLKVNAHLDVCTFAKPSFSYISLEETKTGVLSFVVDHRTASPQQWNLRALTGSGRKGGSQFKHRIKMPSGDNK
jgi:hypothetical protein